MGLVQALIDTIFPTNRLLALGVQSSTARERRANFQDKIVIPVTPTTRELFALR